MGYFDLRRMAGKGVAQCRDEGAHLDAAVDRVDDGAVIATQHAPLIGDFHLSRAFPYSVHHAGRRLAPHDIVTVHAHGADVIRAGIHRLDQLDDLLWRILKIGIQSNHVVAARVLEAGEDRHVLAGVARQNHDPRHLGALRELLPEDGDGAVVAAVIDKDHLIGPLQAIERRIQTIEELLQTALLVVDRNDDRHRSAHLRAPPRISFVAVTTRSTSSSSIAGKSGKVTVSRPMRSAFGNCPSR